MALYRPAAQADRTIASVDRVGRPRVGPALGDTRDRHIYSIRTREEMRLIVLRQAEYALKHFKRTTLDRLTPEQAHAYLKVRATEVGSKRLSQERVALALQPQLRPYEAAWKKDKELRPDNKGPGRLASIPRVMDRETVREIVSHQSERNAFSTEIALAAGLRACELGTLQARADREPTQRREWDPRRFAHLRDPVFYTVRGKGGLVREIAVERELAQRIEATRFQPENRPVTKDRRVPTPRHYDLASGSAWSKSFQRASYAATGESLGAHSCRHTYVKETDAALAAQGFDPETTALFTSQNLGHFRPEITAVYRR